MQTICLTKVLIESALAGSFHPNTRDCSRRCSDPATIQIGLPLEYHRNAITGVAPARLAPTD